MESERLDRARETDERYHLGKLVANAFNEPQLLWDEHQEFLHGLEASAPTGQPRPQPDWSKVHAIHQRLVSSGVIPLSGDGVH